MDAHQDRLRNPLGLDEACENCPDLAAARERVVHGYGLVDADFLVVGSAPTAGAERTGVPFTGDERGRALQGVLGELGLSASPPDAAEPALENTYLTYLARCRHPERPATEGEVRTCDPYLTAEVRMINPEVLLAVGERALRRLALEHTTRDADALDVASEHANEIRGRGIDLVATLDPADWTDGRREALLDALGTLLDRDYRQTKGRRGEATRNRTGDAE
ncbi:MAG: uracil-DNA glycosylase family protein [Halobacteriales archaeon]